MPITFDPSVSPRLIKITSPTTAVDVHGLIQAIRGYEVTPVGITYPVWLGPETSGLANLGGGIQSPLVAQLSGDVRIQFWEGFGSAMITGGTLCGGYLDEPIDNPCVRVQNQIGGAVFGTARAFNFMV